MQVRPDVWDNVTVGTSPLGMENTKLLVPTSNGSWVDLSAQRTVSVPDSLALYSTVPTVLSIRSGLVLTASVISVSP